MSKNNKNDVFRLLCNLKRNCVLSDYNAIEYLTNLDDKLFRLDITGPLMNQLRLDFPYLGERSEL